MNDQDRMTSTEWLQLEMLKAPLAAIEPSVAFVKWVLTGTAAMIGLLISNADTALNLVCRTYLSVGISLLSVSVVLGFVGVITANMVHSGLASQRRLQAVIGDPMWAAKVAKSPFDESAYKSGLIEAYWWPLRPVVRRATKNKDTSPLAPYRVFSKVLSVHTGAAWLQALSAFFGVATMVAGMWA